MKVVLGKLAAVPACEPWEYLDTASYQCLPRCPPGGVWNNATQTCDAAGTPTKEEPKKPGFPWTPVLVVAGGIAVLAYGLLNATAILTDMEADRRRSGKA